MGQHGDGAKGAGSGFSGKKVLGLLIGLAVVVGVVTTIRGVAKNEGYAPTQPIPFSHKIHAGQNNIPCMYCHVGVEKSKHATVPSMNVCMNCHAVVKPDAPNVKKMRALFEKGEAFEWVKVHDMPDHVNFNHKRHVTKGISCETCHGDVKSMAVIRQDKPMTMGWCIDCHRGTTAPAHLFKEPKLEEGKRAVRATPPGSREAGQVAPTNCLTCHH